MAVDRLSYSLEQSAPAADHSRRTEWRMPFGAQVSRDGIEFRVWAPQARRVEVVLEDGERTIQRFVMLAESNGYHRAFGRGLAAGQRYRFALDGILVPDPAARSLPDGVHQAAEAIAADAFAWSDDEWRGIPADALIIYELHVGTFTRRGTFDAAIRRLDALVDLGVTAIELMPVAAFPGARNWGYDGVAPFAPFAGYGGPSGLKRLVDAAHRRGLAVILDVVYNHLGPDGNYLSVTSAGRLFNQRRETAWGAAMNFDGADAAPVRDFFVQNALYWAHEYHVDGLRLDATHAIVDESRVHLVSEIADALHQLDRPRFVFAEDDRNERRLVLPPRLGGYGLDGVWADDLHHQLVRRSAGDREGYFASYSGTTADIVRTLQRGWFFEGQHSAHHDAPRGTPADDLPPPRFIHCIQNHDQVGNRAFGDRLHQRVDAPVYRALSALLLLSPYTPLLFMGQEWCASTPFQFFTNFGGALGRAVSEGRRRELADFAAFNASNEDVPDPEDESTYRASQLSWAERDEPGHARTLALYREVLRLRRHDPAFRERSRGAFAVEAVGDAIVMARLGRAGTSALVVVNLGGPFELSYAHRLMAMHSRHAWSVALSTEHERFSGFADTIALDEQGSLRFAESGAAVLRAS